MADFIDTRELADELNELEAREVEPQDDADGEPGLSDDERERMEALRELRDNISDFPYGETLIPEDEFVDYAQQLAEDVGAINPDAGWPARCIDWQKAADELRQDYTEFELDGVTYLARA